MKIYLPLDSVAVALGADALADAITAEAARRGVTVDSYDVATILISLVDGLWLEQCIDQSLLSLDRAKDLCRRTLAAVLASQPDRRPA